MSIDVYERIRSTLDSAGVQYEYFEHDPVRTSQEAAAIRMTKLEEGAKTLVCHVDKSYYILAVLSVALQADFGTLRKHIDAKKLSLASPDEVLEETGCEIGGIPPFGSCMRLDTYLDPSLSNYEQISFNAGRRTHSIVMRYKDYIATEKPTVVAFAKKTPIH